MLSDVVSPIAVLHVFFTRSENHFPAEHTPHAAIFVPFLSFPSLSLWPLPSSPRILSHLSSALSALPLPPCPFLA